MHDVVVGVDRSERSSRAAALAAEYAAALGTNLHLVTCVDKAHGTNVRAGGDTYLVDPIEDARQFLVSMALSLPHDSVTQAVGTDEPAELLCAEADRLDARLIVVGNRRVQGLSRVLGSVASDVMRNAPCDVLVANTSET